MIWISCPWCEAEATVAPSDLEQEFRCPECATAVDLDDEVEIALPLAA